MMMSYPGGVVCDYGVDGRLGWREFKYRLVSRRVVGAELQYSFSGVA